LGGGVGCAGVTSEVATSLVDGVLLGASLVQAAMDSASVFGFVIFKNILLEQPMVDFF
jgi:hypothetical protein